MSILDRHFGPDDSTPPERVQHIGGRPYLHKHAWTERTVHDMTYWECVGCYVESSVPPDDE